MNDPEVIMHDALPNNNLIAQQKALEAAGIALALVSRVPAPLKSIADQVIRSGRTTTKLEALQTTPRPLSPAMTLRRLAMGGLCDLRVSLIAMSAMESAFICVIWSARRSLVNLAE